jgi:hypothetical protein
MLAISLATWDLPGSTPEVAFGSLIISMFVGGLVIRLALCGLVIFAAVKALKAIDDCTEANKALQAHQLLVLRELLLALGRTDDAATRLARRLIEGQRAADLGSSEAADEPKVG